jgi:NAD(P)H-hydrate epimerase
MGIPVACAEPSAAGADEEARAELGDPDLVIDALFGTGLDRRPEGAAAELIGLVNGYRARGATIMSVDVPSGLDADTGLPVGGEAVRADLTVSLLGLKPGYMTLGAQEFVGDCLVVGIGAPSGLIERLGRPAGGPHPGDHAGGLAAEWTDAPAGLTGSEDAGGEPTRPG